MVKNIIKLICFIIAMILVIKGATNTGYNGVLMMVVGVLIILGELYLYNKQYT
ncbi:DUF6903 family protein [Clostridium thermobutyricum]|uniref:Uncharacterized protein n=1 Tax=Clostridium thermobutyricum DSM 4928 TaxID=1121339 RepID=A0A1V4SVG4_9CLOT|nr:hypothetical protein [Clostridium thermobutyricum]OPX47217.1 hypothetical protein CLTHE_21010 [Clostridium thermobutyricum DSM 4928]